jgi:hypothetical protein
VLSAPNVRRQEPCVKQATTVGIDLAKDVLQVYGVEVQRRPVTDYPKGWWSLIGEFIDRGRNSDLLVLEAGMTSTRTGGPRGRRTKLADQRRSERANGVVASHGMQMRAVLEEMRAVMNDRGQLPEQAFPPASQRPADDWRTRGRCGFGAARDLT